ncbi:unnamed protein product [Bursaphelenchus xylophilus]|uniref:(pine wood nematode) hypothetical protein n=1 Tax=Bursaphelenchus xylophilus TaxID=6326 RepID=A0A1I7SGC0_BURXY|nr:unnamed protein product [Bursaphelenchus xylophilus]CAG9132672.1 unnamed protein product [Bursaphelenchus xylophilus]
MTCNNAVVFPPADGNPAGTADRNFAIRFPSSEPPGPSGIRPSEPLDGRTGIGDVEHAQAGNGGFLVDVLEYKEAHRYGSKCEFCYVQTKGTVCSKPRTDAWLKCEILFLLHHAYTANQNKSIELAESAFRRAGITRRSKATIAKRWSLIQRGKGTDYKEYWDEYFEKFRYECNPTPIVRRKRNRLAAGLQSPSSVPNGYEFERKRTCETPLDTKASSLPLICNLLTGIVGVENVEENMSVECTEPKELSGTANSSVPGLAEGVYERRHNNVNEPAAGCPQDVPVANNLIDSPTTNDRLEAEFKAQLDRAERSYMRRRLPRLKNLSPDERMWIGTTVERLRLETVSEPVCEQWRLANAGLYAAIRSIAVMRPLDAAREAHKTWLLNMKMTERKLRQQIGWVETTRRTKNEARTERQEIVYRKVAKLRRERFPEMDLDSVSVHLKRKLELLKGRIQVRTAERLRRDTREAAGPYGKTALRGQGFAPNVKDATQYWSGLAQPSGQKCSENSAILSDWKELVECNLSSLPDQMEPLVVQGISRASPWKSPGPDGIFNYYWRQDFIVDWLKQLMLDSLRTGHYPWKLSSGRTVLLYKDGDPTKAENYRPITCLNGCFKMINSVVSEVILKRVENTIALPIEQMALRRKVWACVESQIWDQIKQRKLSDRTQKCKVAWVDFSKAYDSLNHDAIKFVIGVLKLPTGINNYLLDSMQNWSTHLELKSSGKVVRGPSYPIKRGVLQGDSLSPTLFVVVTSIIVRHIKTIESSDIQMYMDDIKLYGKDQETLTRLIKELQTVSNKLGLCMNLKKCAILGDDLPEEINGIEHLKESYKYLGVPQREITQVRATMAALEKKILTEVDTSLGAAELSYRQRISRVNSKIAPLVRFVVQSMLVTPRDVLKVYNRLGGIDVEIRRRLVKYEIRYKKSNVARLYLDRKVGGIGFVNLCRIMVEAVAARAVYCRLAPSFNEFQDFLAEQNTSPITAAQTILDKCGINIELSTSTLGDVKKIVRNHYHELWLTAWKNTGLYKRWENDHVDIKRSSLWINRGNLSANNARIGIGIQDNSIFCRGFVGNKCDTKYCRLCGDGIESVSHIVTGCPTHRTNLYIERHDCVARNVYAYLAIRYGIPVPHYTQRVKTIEKNGDQSVELYWNYKFPCTRALEACRPDIVLIDKVSKRTHIIEVAVSWRGRLQEMVDRKVYKYTVNGEYEADGSSRGWNIVRELNDQYGFPVEVYTLVIGAGGEILPCTVKDVERLTGGAATDNLIERMERSAVLGSCRIIKRHLAL